MNDYNVGVSDTLGMLKMLIEAEIKEPKCVKCQNTLEVLESIRLKIDCQILAQKIKYKLENSKEGDWFL